MKKFNEIRELSQAAQQQMDIYKFKKQPKTVKSVDAYLAKAKIATGPNSFVPMSKVDPALLANIKKNFPDTKLDDKAVNNIIVVHYRNKGK